VKKIILSRTDNLGDVILTLPMTGFLRKHFPGVKIFFLGKSYTRPLIESCAYVHKFIDWDEIKNNEQKAIEVLRSINADAIVHVFPVHSISRIAMKANIPVRIATTGRWYSWIYSNKLVRMSRRRSDLHEAQLNIRMLEPLGIPVDVRLDELPNWYGYLPFVPFASTNSQIENQQSTIKIDNRQSAIENFPPVTRHPSPVTKIILHPKSKGSAREWGLENYSKLIRLLPAEKYEIFVTGTKDEGDLMRDFLKQHEGRVHDMTGKLTLDQLFDLIDSCDALVAASTGPLHIAAALGKRAIGIYAPMRPIFPKRWAPLGINAVYLCKEEECHDCRKSGDCHCIREITPESVMRVMRGDGG
jgi:heptosyltransferase-3